MTIHKTVLMKETVEALNLEPGMVVVDATLGGGGHASEVLKKIGETGKLIAFDQDQKAIDRFEKKLSTQNGNEVSSGKNKNVLLIHDNFSMLKDRLTSIDIQSVDAILADLGISSDQLEDERGISFQKNAPLDMRMNLSEGMTAADIVNTYSDKDLIRILREYGDEQYARAITSSIIKRRLQKPFETTFELVEAIENAVPGEYKRKKIHPATKTFQALRIEVNKELDSLKSFLSQAVEMLRSGARMAIITFHSGEDAIVKHTFRENARGCICPPEFPVCRCGNKPLVKIITTKPIAPSAEEIEENPRARSAKLRVVERC